MQKHIYIYSPSSAVRDKASFKRGVKRLEALGHAVEIDEATLATSQRNNQPAKTDGFYRKYRSIQVEHDHERHTECERDYDGRSHVDQTGRGRGRIPGRGDLQWSGTPDTPDMDW